MITSRNNQQKFAKAAYLKCKSRAVRMLSKSPGRAGFSLQFAKSAAAGTHNANR
jgi:hypothetical protein